VPDLEAAAAHVRGRKDTAAPVVSIGFCMGGGRVAGNGSFGTGDSGAAYVVIAAQLAE
jgi:hypothetical protein